MPRIPLTLENRHDSEMTSQLEKKTQKSNNWLDLGPNFWVRTCISFQVVCLAQYSHKYYVLLVYQHSRPVEMTGQF